MKLIPREEKFFTYFSEQTALQSGLQQAQTELRAQEVAIATREGEFRALQHSQRVLHQKIDTVVYEIQSVASQEHEGSQKRAALGTQIGELEARERGRQQQLQRARGDPHRQADASPRLRLLRRAV